MAIRICLACKLLACALQTAKQAALAAVHERREAVRQTLQLAPAPPGALRRSCGATLLPSNGASLLAGLSYRRQHACMHAFMTLPWAGAAWLYRKDLSSGSSPMFLLDVPGAHNFCTSREWICEPCESVGASEDARWVDAAWLGQWADGAEASPPIDNAPLLCEHGKLDPSKAAGRVCFYAILSCTTEHLC